MVSRKSKYLELKRNLENSLENGLIESFHLPDFGETDLHQPMSIGSVVLKKREYKFILREQGDVFGSVSSWSELILYMALSPLCFTYKEDITDLYEEVCSKFLLTPLDSNGIFPLTGLLKEIRDEIRQDFPSLKNWHLKMTRESYQIYQIAFYIPNLSLTVMRIDASSFYVSKEGLSFSKSTRDSIVNTINRKLNRLFYYEEI